MTVNPNDPILEAFTRLGRVEGRMDSLETRQMQWEQKIEAQLNNICESIEKLNKAYNEGHGAWKLLTIIGYILIAIPSFYTFYKAVYP